ncbi:MAG TPA: DUF2723 domain-containing protein, partial [Longimicrobiales bacterium]|nr:DUF2723 domain-containing protein [Longimicrobiales bacterium]
VLLAPTGLSVAVRVNLFAAATSAAASAFFFLVAHRVLATVLADGRRALVGAAAATLVGATAFTVWHQSTVNEKVYTLSVLVIAAVTWLAVRWRDRRHDPGSVRLLLAALFLTVLGSTNHLMSVLPLPALGLFVLLTDPGLILRWRVLARGALLVVVGISFNFVLPIRAELDPAINEGDPTCESALGAATAIFTMGKRGCPMLAANLTRQQYRKPPITERMAPWGAQLENWFQYFDWQWARGVHPSELPGTPRLPLTLLFLGLGACGLWAVFRADRILFSYLAVLAATLTLGLVYYLNFRYGYSLAPEITDPALHEVRERDYFFVAGFLLWGSLAGMGIAWAWGALASISRSPRPWAVTSPVLALALVPLVLNWGWASRAGDWAARDWAYDLLMSVEPYAILFTNGDNDTFPLWYLQEVEGLRKDVTVVVGQYLQTTWYPKQLRELTEPDRQRPFLPEQAEGVYAAPPRPPSAPVTDMDGAMMDRVGGSRLEEDVTIPFPTLAVTYPAGMVLDRSHQLALSFIHDSIDERPVYFASAGGMMNDLGLTRWGVRHGLATKLVLRDADGALPEGWVRGSPEYGAETFDLERSLRLYRDVYSFRGLRDREVWADRASLNIPWQYYALALQLSDAAALAGRRAELVRTLQSDAVSFQIVANGGSRGSPGA